MKYRVIWHDCEDDRIGTSFEVDANTPKEGYYKAIKIIKSYSEYLDGHFCGTDLECLVDENSEYHHPRFFLEDKK